MRTAVRIHPFERGLGPDGYRIKQTQENAFFGLPYEDKLKIIEYWAHALGKLPGSWSTQTMLNMESFRVSGRTLTETVSIGNYAMYVAKRNADLEPESAGLSDAAARQIRIRGATSVALTGDGFLVLGRRPSGLQAAEEFTTMPEAWLSTSRPDPFDATAHALVRELGVARDSVISSFMTGLGEELDYAGVHSSMAIELSVSKEGLESAFRPTGMRGAATSIKFLRTDIGSLNGFIEEGHTGSSNIAVLNFIGHYHTGRQLENILRLQPEKEIHRTLEGFCAPMGVEVSVY
ncbi:MAG: hypothetical protein KGH98_01245 [Candidatus Micrarchaeota archaeon]|nr:hypothetical protein [Candidatus Micrarchaeota archaeon]